MSKNRIFSRIGAAHPSYSVFDLSYEKKLTCDMGQLIPVMCDEVVPGDYFKIGNQAVVRYMPLVAPILHEVNMFVHLFFVPYRLLWNNADPDNWQSFITGGVDGSLVPTIPTWSPTNRAVGSLWDYLGFETDKVPTGALPLDFPRRAYNMIYNEYYRDETLTPAVALTNESILTRAWGKDYLTSALPWQQRGTAPALPISGTTSAVWSADQYLTYPAVNSSGYTVDTSIQDIGTADFRVKTSGGKQALETGRLTTAKLNANTVNLASATTFNISDLRLAFQTQRWLERNARAGARYTEFLHSHFGVSPRDERLQRPEYIGGSKTPVIFSEVLQTSQTGTTPQGNMAGHGIAISNAYCGKYHVKEFGLIMGLMSIIPKTQYQQGINRQWLRRTKYDFYFPEFANLSEQAITSAELFVTDGSAAENTTIFGYQGRYDEMRYKPNMTCGKMRTTFSYWHLGRIFSTKPLLNDSFIQCVPRKDIFAVPSEHGLLINFGNLIKAYRPMPLQSSPGLIDHH